MSLEISAPRENNEKESNISEKLEKELEKIKKVEEDIENNILDKNEKSETIIRNDLEDIDTSGININFKEGKATIKIILKHNQGDLKIDSYKQETSFFRMKNGNIHIKNIGQKTHIYNKEEFKNKAFDEIQKDLKKTIYKNLDFSHIDEATQNLVAKKIKTYTGIIYNSLTKKNPNTKNIEKNGDNIYIPLIRKGKDISIHVIDETNGLENFMDQQEWNFSGKEKTSGVEETILIKFCECCWNQIPEDTRKNIDKKQQYTIFYPKFAQAFEEL